MSLLQISEPGQTPAPHQRRLAAGIDLGTTHSLVATVRSGQAEALSDNEVAIYCHLLCSIRLIISMWVGRQKKKLKKTLRILLAR